MSFRYKVAEADQFSACPQQWPLVHSVAVIKDDGDNPSGTDVEVPLN